MKKKKKKKERGRQNMLPDKYKQVGLSDSEHFCVRTYYYMLDVLIVKITLTIGES